MGVTKIYKKEDVKAAIDRADYNLFKQWRSVRSDLTSQQFANQGKDVGHTFRHVEDTADTNGKSTYMNEETLLQITMQLLNSSKGQQVLAKLDNASPNGSFIESNPANYKIETAVGGDWYGYRNENSQHSTKIKRAACIVMKLGESVLWVHTSYPIL